MGAAAPWTNTPHPAFDLRIRTGDDKATGYRRQLDLETGEVVTRWDGYEQRVFSSRPHNVNVILLRASAGHKLDVTLKLEDTPGILTNAFKSVRSEATPGWLSYTTSRRCAPTSIASAAAITSMPD